MLAVILTGWPKEQSPATAIVNPFIWPTLNPSVEIIISPWRIILLYASLYLDDLLDFDSRAFLTSSLETTFFLFVLAMKLASIIKSDISCIIAVSLFWFPAHFELYSITSLTPSRLKGRRECFLQTYAINWTNFFTFSLFLS